MRRSRNGYWMLDTGPGLDQEFLPAGLDLDDNIWDLTGLKLDDDSGLDMDLILPKGRTSHLIKG